MSNATYNCTQAARDWLSRAKQTLDAERYQNLLRHIAELRGNRLTKRCCTRALAALKLENEVAEVQ